MILPQIYFKFYPTYPHNRSFLFHGLADGVTIHIQQRQQHADVGQDHLSGSKKMEEIRVKPPEVSKTNGWLYSENVMISEELESKQRTLLV